MRKSPGVVTTANFSIGLGLPEPAGAQAPRHPSLILCLFAATLICPLTQNAAASLLLIRVVCLAPETHCGVFPAKVSCNSMLGGDRAFGALV
jgi:hypothetical protein